MSCTGSSLDKGGVTVYENINQGGACHTYGQGYSTDVGPRSVSSVKILPYTEANLYNKPYESSDVCYKNYKNTTGQPIIVNDFRSVEWDGCEGGATIDKYLNDKIATMEVGKIPEFDECCDGTADATTCGYYYNINNCPTTTLPPLSSTTPATTTTTNTTPATTTTTTTTTSNNAPDINIPIEDYHWYTDWKIMVPIVFIFILAVTVFAYLLMTRSSIPIPAPLPTPEPLPIV